MAVKFKIGQSAYDSLPADVKKEYKKVGDDYQLDVEGYEDAAEIKRARDAANEERNTAKRERDEANAAKAIAERKASALEAGNTDKAAAIADVEDKLGKKHAAELAARDEKLAKASGAIQKGTRERVANSIAEKISTAPKLLAPLIAARIAIEVGDDFADTMKILSADGKATASSIDDLAKEFQSNKEYAAIMKASNGSGGGGAPRVPSGGGAPRPGNNPPSNDGRPADLTKMHPRDLAEQIKADREARGQT